MPKVHTQIVNYHERRGRRPKGRLVNIGFFAHQVPRLTLRCALLGHRPVVDGTNSTPRTAAYIGRRNRWVVCGRCGERPNPQGSLDPARWNIGDRYTGGHTNVPSRHDLIRLKDREHYLPGPFVDGDARGKLGGQLVIGRPELASVGFELKVGNGASEQPLAASLHLGWLGALYLSTERHGRGVQRLLNPDPVDAAPGRQYLSKVVKVEVRRGRLQWRLWAPRDLTRREAGLPWWRDVDVSLRFGDGLFGRTVYDRVDVPGGIAARLVLMPEGDYLVQLKLRQVTRGRAGGPLGTGPRRRRRMPYEVSWSTLGKGIPTEGPLRGRIFGSDVTVSDAAVEAGTWPAAAVAAIAADIAAWRTRHGWEPTGVVTVNTNLDTVPGAGGAADPAGAAVGAGGVGE